MAFAAVGNVWFVILWTRAMAEESGRVSGAIVDEPLWSVLVAGGAVAVGLYSFAMVVNDALDIRRDRALHPDRPLASGRITMETAAVLVSLTLLLSFGGAALLGMGSVWLTMVTAGAILVYFGVARFFPSLGLVAVGLIYAAHMMIPNWKLAFVWPVWTVMTHELLVVGLVYMLTSARAPKRGRVFFFAALGWLFWSGVLLWVGARRSGEGALVWGVWPGWVWGWAWVGPAVLGGMYVLVVRGKIRKSADGWRAADKVQRYGALWLTLYATAWMIAVRHVEEAMVLGGLAVAGFLGMTVLREVYGLVEQPVGYRR